jgi:hypothetical protein
MGSIYAIATKEFKEEKNIYVQFLNKNENGGVEILQVKMTNNNDIVSLKENMAVKIPVKVTSFNNNMYYTQIEPLLK